MPLALARRSALVREMLGGDEEGEIPLPCVSAETLDRLLAVLAGAPEDLRLERPLPAGALACMAPLQGLGTGELFAVYRAANYLEINDLIELCAARIAALVRGKQPHEMAALLGCDVDEDKVAREELWLD